MFGCKKDQLVTGLARVSCQLCGYLGTICDCKYMDENDDYYRNSEQTGCCETAMAATLINAMTQEEFFTIAERAGIRITLTDDEALALGDIFKKMKKQRNNQLRAEMVREDE